jgi:PAS domain S-box-containing protein
VLDRNANVVFWNRAAEEISGYAREEVIGRHRIWELLYPDERYRASIPLQAEAIIQQGDAAISLETTIQRKDGNLRVISWNSRNIFDDGKNPIGSIALGQDITKRKMAEQELSRSFERVKAILNSTLRAMGAMVEARDPYTAGHNRRVAQLSVAIARELGLSAEQIEGIDKAGLGHDIGKVSVPAEILMKPTRLSAAEYLILRTHPRVSYDILKEIEFSQPIATIVLQHHERLDGSGYPLGISGHEILVEARIMAIADVVEAMSSHRPYRPALGIGKALAEINTQRGILYDPDAVHVCSNLFTQKRFEFEAIND